MRPNNRDIVRLEQFDNVVGDSHFNRLFVLVSKALARRKCHSNEADVAVFLKTAELLYRHFHSVPVGREYDYRLHFMLNGRLEGYFQAVFEVLTAFLEEVGSGRYKAFWHRLCQLETVDLGERLTGLAVLEYSLYELNGIEVGQIQPVHAFLPIMWLPRQIVHMHSATARVDPNL